MDNDDKNFALRFQIGIIKELHKQNLLTENQMTRCIELITSKQKSKQDDTQSMPAYQAQ